MSQSRSNAETGLADAVWSGALAVWLASILILGGAGTPPPFIQIYITASSLVVILGALWRLREGFPSHSATYAAVIAALCLALPLAQLIPIPFEIWKSLPGREVAARAFDALGATPSSLATSLGPTGTKRASLSLLPPVAAFLGVLSVPRKHFWFISAAIVFCALLGFMIGIIQKSRGFASGLYFYVDSDIDDAQKEAFGAYATGTFGNRNLFAAQLFSSVPFLAAFAMALAKRWQLRPILTFGFTLVYIGLLVAVLATIGSRAGTVLAMVSILLTFALVLRLGTPNGGRISAGKGLIALIVGLVVMAQASMVGILRLAATDPLRDSRVSIATVSLEAAKAQFPAGSGFGTFVPVYQLYEGPNTIVNSFVNRAHNDWLEVALEGGAPALVLMALFLGWLLYVLYKALRIAAQDPPNAHIRAAGIAALLLMLHAIGDFPFRTDALLTLLGLCFGFLALATAAPAMGESSARRSGGSRGQKSSPKPSPKPGSNPGSFPPGGKPGAFRPNGGGFGNRRGTSAPPLTPDPSEDVNPA
jgi:hypothetical protein